MALALGEDGLIKTAMKASEEYEKAAKEEKDILKQFDNIFATIESGNSSGEPNTLIETNYNLGLLGLNGVLEILFEPDSFSGDEGEVISQVFARNHQKTIIIIPDSSPEAVAEVVLDIHYDLGLLDDLGYYDIGTLNIQVPSPNIDTIDEEFEYVVSTNDGIFENKEGTVIKEGHINIANEVEVVSAISGNIEVRFIIPVRNCIPDEDGNITYTGMKSSLISTTPEYNATNEVPDELTFTITTVADEITNFEVVATKSEKIPKGLEESEYNGEPEEYYWVDYMISLDATLNTRAITEVEISDVISDGGKLVQVREIIAGGYINRENILWNLGEKAPEGYTINEESFEYIGEINPNYTVGLTVVYEKSKVKGETTANTAELKVKYNGLGEDSELQTVTSLAEVTFNEEMEYLAGPDIEVTVELASGQANMVEPGETAKFVITITNIGEIELNNIVVTDSLDDAWKQEIVMLPHTADNVATFEFEYIIPIEAVDNETITNVVTVICDEIIGEITDEKGLEVKQDRIIEEEIDDEGMQFFADSSIEISQVFSTNKEQEIELGPFSSSSSIAEINLDIHYDIQILSHSLVYPAGSIEIKVPAPNVGHSSSNFTFRVVGGIFESISGTVAKDGYVTITNIMDIDSTTSGNLNVIFEIPVRNCIKDPDGNVTYTGMQTTLSESVTTGTLQTYTTEELTFKILTQKDTGYVSKWSYYFDLIPYGFDEETVKEYYWIKYELYSSTSSYTRKITDYKVTDNIPAGGTITLIQDYWNGEVVWDESGVNLLPSSVTVTPTSISSVSSHLNYYVVVRYPKEDFAGLNVTNVATIEAKYEGSSAFEEIARTTRTDYASDFRYRNNVNGVYSMGYNLYSTPFCGNYIVVDKERFCEEVSFSKYILYTEPEEIEIYLDLKVLLGDFEEAENSPYYELEKGDYEYTYISVSAPNRCTGATIYVMYEDSTDWEYYTSMSNYYDSYYGYYYSYGWYGYSISNQGIYRIKVVFHDSVGYIRDDYYINTEFRIINEDLLLEMQEVEASEITGFASVDVLQGGISQYDDVLGRL